MDHMESIHIIIHSDHRDHTADQLLGWVITIDIHGSSQNLHHLDSSMELKLGSSHFSRTQNNCCSSSACATCIYCGLSVKINMRKTLREDCGRICFAFIFACGRQKPEDPNLSPMADDAITQGGIGGLGSPVYIYGYHTHGELWLQHVNQFTF